MPVLVDKPVIQYGVEEAVQSGLDEIYACEVNGVRHDTGNKLGFLKAEVCFALHRPELAGPFRRYLEALDLKVGADT